MADQKPDPIPYATPTPRGGLRGWLLRRGATSGQRMIAMAVMALVGVNCLSSPWPYPLGTVGYWTFRVAMILFVVEYLLSFHQ